MAHFWQLGGVDIRCNARGESCVGRAVGDRHEHDHIRQDSVGVTPIFGASCSESEFSTPSVRGLVRKYPFIITCNLGTIDACSGQWRGRLHNPYIPASSSRGEVVIAFAQQIGTV